MKIRPLANQVLIEEIPMLKTPEGFWLTDGIISPEHRVLAVGPKADPALTPGSRVLIDAFRCMAKTQVGDHAFLLADSSLALVFP
jgi:co-chaperonin GroES (HSP10)